MAHLSSDQSTSKSSEFLRGGGGAIYHKMLEKIFEVVYPRVQIFKNPPPFWGPLDIIIYKSSYRSCKNTVQKKLAKPWAKIKVENKPQFFASREYF